ncbi:MAG: hypothetical protein HRU40_15020 [Saprospiraceae bacterium]|nr:hypothetical protein [Saprospiraceae bacterium]
MVEVSKNSLFEQAFNPIYQALLCLAGVVVVSLVALGVDAVGIIETPKRFPWMATAAFMLSFAMFNSIFALSTKNMLQYWSRSIYSFLGLALLASGFAWLLSSLPISEAGSYRWILIVVTIGYMVFLAMMTSMKRIVEFAQREEWNHPRIRSKNDRNDRDKHIQ